MASSTFNIVLKENLLPGTMLSMPYPEGKNKNHFFASSDHKLSVGATFYRYPRDFLITFAEDRIVLHWKFDRTMPAGTVLHFMIDEPIAEHFRSNKIDVAIEGMVAAPVHLITLGSPLTSDEEFYFSGSHARLGPIQLEQSTPDAPRNVTITANHDNSHAIFTVEGEDIYGLRMIEQIIGPKANQTAAGKKSFAKLLRVEPNQPCREIVQIGTGNTFGLPVFLPAEGFVISQIIDGNNVTGGIITPGDSDIPTATSGDRRGTYILPPGYVADGKKLVMLLVALVNPSNIGTPDYEG